MVPGEGLAIWDIKQNCLHAEAIHFYSRTMICEFSVNEFVQKVLDIVGMKEYVNHVGMYASDK